MKKLLTFFLVALLTTTVSWAETITFEIGTDSGTAGTTATMTKDGITITTNGTFARTDNYRSYANSTTSISSTVGNITSIVVTCVSDYNNFKGATTGTFNKDGNIVTWTGNSANVYLQCCCDLPERTKCMDS